MQFDTLKDIAPHNLPNELAVHLPAAEANARENIKAVKSRHKAQLDDLRDQLWQTFKSTTPKAAKTIRLRHLASENSRLFSSHTACRSGCSHCCHIDVPIPRSEAKLIAKAIGRTLSEPVEISDMESSNGRRKFFGVKCTFLEGGKCSIYAHRPLVCRTLVNMDSTDLLCRLVPDVNVPVPYLNATEYVGYFIYLMQKEDFADIREWFPDVSIEVEK